MQSPASQIAEGEHDARQRTLPAHLLDAEDFGEDDSELDGEGRVRRVRWQVVEDQKIVEAVRLLGKRWPEIAALLPGRTGDGVRNRWHRLQARGEGEPEEGAPPTALTEADLTAVLAGDGEPSGGRKMWSAEEDAIIQAGVAKYGCQWRLVVAQLPGRTDSSTRNRWKRLQKEAAAAGNGDDGRAAPPPPRRQRLVDVPVAPVPMAGGSTSSSSPPTAEGSDEVTTRTPSPGDSPPHASPGGETEVASPMGSEAPLGAPHLGGSVPPGVALDIYDPLLGFGMGASPLRDGAGAALGGVMGMGASPLRLAGAAGDGGTLGGALGMAAFHDDTPLSPEEASAMVNTFLDGTFLDSSGDQHPLLAPPPRAPPPPTPPESPPDHKSNSLEMLYPAALVRAAAARRVRFALVPMLVCIAAAFVGLHSEAAAAARANTGGGDDVDVGDGFGSNATTFAQFPADVGGGWDVWRVGVGAALRSPSAHLLASAGGAAGLAIVLAAILPDGLPPRGVPYVQSLSWLATALRLVSGARALQPLGGLDLSAAAAALVADPENIEDGGAASLARLAALRHLLLLASVGVALARSLAVSFYPNRFWTTCRATALANGCLLLATLAVSSLEGAAAAETTPHPPEQRLALCAVCIGVAATFTPSTRRRIARALAPASAPWAK